MKVLHLANIAGQASGGIGDVVHEVVMYQRKAGLDVSMWFPGTQEMQREVEEITGLRDGSIRAIPRAVLLGNVVPYGLLGKSGRARQQFDLVHQHGIWVPNSLFTLALGPKVKAVVNPHGLLEPDRLKLSRWKKRLVAMAYEDRNLRQASAFVASSEQEARGIREYGLTQPIVVIPNGVDEAFFESEETRETQATNLRRRLHLEKDVRVMLFLSRIHPLKGASMLIDAVSELRAEFSSRKWVLVIAGPDELNHEAELKHRVEELQLGALVKFSPPLYGAEKIEAFAGADVFALPSYNENFGIVVAEALAAGTPVLTSRQMPWQITEQRKCGLWVKRTPQGIKRAMATLVAIADDERREMGKRGKVLASESYRWPQISRQMHRLYDWVLSDAAAPAGLYESRAQREAKL